MALTKIDDRGLKTPIDLLDNEKIRLGTGNDLEIYHDGSHNILLGVNGADFKIKDADHNSAIFDTSAGVELYYDNVKKLETYSSGTLITGNCKATGDFRIENDTGKIELGTSADLQLYHDGSNSYIKDGGTGGLRLCSSEFNVKNAGNSEVIIRGYENGSVELYHDNAKKYETTSTGATLTGRLLVNNDTHSQYPVEVKNSNGNFIAGIYESSSGDGNHGIFYLNENGGTNHVKLSTNGSSYLTGGYLGLGTTSVTQKLHIREDSNPQHYLMYLQNRYSGVNSSSLIALSCGGVDFSDNRYAYIGAKISAASETGTNLLFATNPNGGSAAERLRIDSNGRVLIASGASRTIWGANPQTQIEKLDSNAALSIIRNTNSAAGPWIALCKSRGTANGAVTIVQDGDSLGSIDWFGADGVDLANVSAEIKAEIDGTPGSDDVPGRLLFKTTADGASSPTERMRIDNAGNVLVGTNVAGTDSATSGLYLSGLGSVIVRRNGNMSYWKTLDTGGYNSHVFLSANTTVGTIVVASSSTTYNTSSDYRLKENVSGITDGITRVKQLKPSKFNWISDDTNTPVDGFLAHEVSSLVPEAITGTKDAVATEADDEACISIGDPVYQQIDHSKLVPLLTAALKEAITKIETLETKVAALEAA